MKRSMGLTCIIAMMTLLIACSDAAKKSGEVDTDIENIPILIDRAILTDALWGIGEEIPPDVTCIAGSQFIFDSVLNPFIITTNDHSDEHFVAPVVATSSLNIVMKAKDVGMRSDTCAAGDLYYIVSATPQIPIDIEVAGESCPNLEELATAEGTAFPQNGTLTAHFESHDASTPVEIQSTETGNPEEQEAASTSDDDPTKPVLKMFKLVIDECTNSESAVDVEVQ